MYMGFWIMDGHTAIRRVRPIEKTSYHNQISPADDLKNENPCDCDSV